MLMADDANRSAYAYDPANLAKGVRIFQGRAGTDPNGHVVVPQQIVGVAVANSTWTFHTSKQGERRVTLGVLHLEANDTSYVSTDVAAPPITPETRLARTTEILMRGTIYRDADDSTAEVIDPYDSPLNEDGEYDIETMRILSNRPPDVRQTSKETFALRPVKKYEDYLTLDLIRDFAVAYGVLATWTINIDDRDKQTRGGWKNG
jgi:hypothetical protein